MEWINETLGNDFISNNTYNDDLGAKKNIALYFSASWCGPCKKFTPYLHEFYDLLKEEDSNFLEIIFVSRDTNEESFDKYHKEMPWLALKFNRELSDELVKKYSINGIPSLIILDGQTGDIKDTGGVETI